MCLKVIPFSGTISRVIILIVDIISCIMRQVQEKHQAKKQKLYYAFVDLEKAFNRVPREVVRSALRTLGVDEWLIRTVMALYTEACTVIIIIFI